jgi:hypothetical protein
MQSSEARAERSLFLWILYRDLALEHAPASERHSAQQLNQQPSVEILTHGTHLISPNQLKIS